MSRILTVMTVLIAATAFAAPEASLATAEKAVESKSSALVAARSKISQIASDPKLMTTVMKTLSSAEQLQYVGEVNRAIAAMSAAEEEKTALLLNVNRAAIDGAAKGNLTAVVAEIYATVPVSAMPVVHESFAESVFNRAANPKVTFTDAQYAKAAGGIMKVIAARLATATDSETRNGFAALMLVKGANSSSKEINDAIIAAMPASVREMASKDWIPAGTAEGNSRNYDSLLAVAAGEVITVDSARVLRIAGVQHTDAMLADLAGPAVAPSSVPADSQPVIDAVYNPIQFGMPQLSAGDAASDPAAQIGQLKEIDEALEAGGYQWQTTK